MHTYFMLLSFLNLKLSLILQVRIGDMRQSHLVDAKVHGVLVKKRVTEEGKTYPLYLHSLEFEANDMGDKIVLMWPMVLSHKITESSPLWNIRPSDLTNEKYEIIIYAEGTLESTGEYCQARSSYLPCELLWGHRFDRIEQFDAGNGRWEVDFSGFNDVVYNSNIRHSAKELNDFKFRTKGKQEKPPRPPSPLKSVTYDLPPEYPAVLPPSEHENVDYHRPLSGFAVLHRLSNPETDASSEATDDTVIERDLGEGGTVDERDLGEGGTVETHSSDEESYGDAEETCKSIDINLQDAVE